MRSEGRRDYTGLAVQEALRLSNVVFDNAAMLIAEQLKPLRAACAVAATGSTVAAAQALHVSQSSVVRAVQALEAGLGQTLFERVGRGMRPTAAGAGLVRRGARALAHLAAAGRGSGAHAGLGAGAATGFAQADEPVDSLAWARSRLAAGVSHRHLQVLRSLAHTRSETLSARALGISQSAVHQTLAQLEHMSGAALFVRARRGLRLTEAGDSALQACKLALAELQQAEDEWALDQGRVQGRLLIGTLPFSTGQLLSEAVDRVLKAHPGLSVTIIDGTYDALLAQLQQADIDFIVGALRPALPDTALQQETLFLDQLAVVARAAHPLVQRRQLGWPDLAGAAWILPMPNTPAQAAFEQALQVAGIPVPVDALRVNSALMMQALLAQGDRLALMSPRQVQRELAAGQLVQLPVNVRHQPRMIGIVRRADHWPTSAAQTLLDALRAVARDIAEPAQDPR